MRLPYPYDFEPIHDIPAANKEVLLTALSADGSQWFSSSQRLAAPRTTRLFEGLVHGAESVAVSPDGERLTMVDKRGFVQHARAQDYTLLNDSAPVYVGPGRPLGFEYKDETHLLLCDSLKGLLEVDLESGQITILSNRVTGGAPINYANDLGVDESTGVVYFSSSTRGVVAYSSRGGFYDTMRSFTLDMLAADVSGRLLRYDPRTRETSVVVEGLWYANGVAVSAEGDYVLVVETMGMRVMRHWLKGDRAGSTEVLVDNLPGFPDGVSRAPDGSFWVSLVAPHPPFLHYLFASPPAVSRVLRAVFAHLSVTLGLTQLVASPWGAAVKVSGEGKVLDVLLDPTGEQVATVSAVTEVEGRVFMGNLGGDYITVHSL